MDPVLKKKKYALCSREGDNLTMKFIYQQEDASLHLHVKQKDKGLQLGAIWSGNRETNMDPQKVIKWVEDSAKVTSNEWGMPFPHIWLSMHDGLCQLFKKSA